MSTEKNDISTLIDRLARLIFEKANGKWTVFAKKAGIAHGTFFPYLQGRKPSGDNLVRIRDTFGVNINWLMTGEGDPYTSEAHGRANEPAALYEVKKEPLEGIDLSGAGFNEIEGLIDLAREVLTSRDRQAADALERNIRYFAHAVRLSGRVGKLESQLQTMQTILKKAGIMEGSPEDEAI